MKPSTDTLLYRTTLPMGALLRSGALMVAQSGADEDPHRGQPVAPRDLLALRVAAPVVGDRDLVDPQVAAADGGGDLRLDAEAVLAERQPPQHVGAEGLVAGLH